MKLSCAVLIVCSQTLVGAGDCPAQQPLQQDTVLLQAKALMEKKHTVETGDERTSEHNFAEEAMKVETDVLQRRDILKQELVLVVSKRAAMIVEANQHASDEQMIRSDCSSCDDGVCPSDCVSCGAHWATGCAGCPQGDKWISCNGDCMWQGGVDGQCLLTASVSSGRLLVAAEGTGQIKRANSDGTELRTFLAGNTPCASFAKTPTQRLADSMTSRPTGLAVDEVAGFVFWTDHFGGSRVMAVDPDDDEPYRRSEYRWAFGASVNRASLSGGLVTPIVTSGRVLQDPAREPILWDPSVELTWPHFLDLDRTNQKVYWTDLLDRKIQRANYDGTGFEATFLETDGEPGGIAVDADAGFLYFSDYVSEGSIGHVIKRASLDGSEPEVLLGAAGLIQGLALDLARAHIYFAAAGTTRNPGGIMRAGISESSRRRGKYGILYNSKPYDSSSDVEHAVLSGQDAALLDPVDVAGDWERGHLYWTGKEELTARSGLGGRVYRTSLCSELPQAHRRRRQDRRQSEGDFAVVAELQGDPFAAPFPAALVILSDVEADASGTTPGPACAPDPAGGFLVPAASLAPQAGPCVDQLNWSSSTGALCRDFEEHSWCTEDGQIGSGWGPTSTWGQIEDYARDGVSAFDACCVCGADSTR